MESLFLLVLNLIWFLLFLIKKFLCKVGRRWKVLLTLEFFLIDLWNILKNMGFPLDGKPIDGGGIAAL